MKHLSLLVISLSLLLVGAACQKNVVTQNQATTTLSNTTPPPVLNANTAAKLTIYRGDVTSHITPEVITLTGTGTQGLDVDPQTGLVYLGNNGSVISKCTPISTSGEGRDTMSIVDPVLKKEIARPKTDGGPIWPTVDVARDVVYMASSGSGTIAVHKRGSGAKIQSIKTSGLPHMAGIFGNMMVVSNTFDKSQTYYSAIDLTTRKVIGHYTSPALPHPVAVDADAKIAYMMGVQDGSVVAIDLTTGQPQANFKFEGAGGQLAISKKFNTAYTSSSTPGTSAAAFDLTTHAAVGTMSFNELNAPGSSVTVDEEAGLLYIVVADRDALAIANADTLQPLGYFKTGTCPYGVRLDIPRGLGYVSNSGSHSLTMFDLKKVRSAVE